MNVRCGAAIFVVLSLLSAPVVSNATELRHETVKAWDEYVLEANTRMETRLYGRAPFLWIDEVPGRAQRVLQGQIMVEPGRNSSPQKVPYGLVHDWVGAAFIPQATIEDILAIVNDYNRYHEIYTPAVVDSKLLESAGNEYKFSMIMMQRVLSVTAAVDSEYQSHCAEVDPKRWYCTSHSTYVREIKHFRQADEHELPPDEGSGFVWRLYSITRFQERDGGVYVELEALGLSRDIPFEIRWLVKPIVEHLPKNALSRTLEQTRDSVHSSMYTSRRQDSGETLGGNCSLAPSCNRQPVLPVSPKNGAHQPDYARSLSAR